MENIELIKLESKYIQKSTMIAQHDEIQIEDYLNENVDFFGYKTSLNWKQDNFKSQPGLHIIMKFK